MEASKPGLDPQKNKGKGPEVSTDGRPVNPPGVYVHKDTGAKFITAPGEEGVVQADSLMTPLWQNAWEWTADVPSREELLASRKAQEVEEAAQEALQKGKEAAEHKAAVKEATERLKVAEADLAVEVN